MENIRVIKLNPNTFISNVSTFDEAFDEYSFASGKRKQKKADKIRAKAEKQRAKAELQQAKGEKKVARVGKRTARKVARQEGRDTIASMRQARRTANKTARVERRKIGEEQEPEIDETTQGTEDDNVVDETNGNGENVAPSDYTESGDESTGEYAPEQGEWGEEPNYSEDEGDVNDSNDSEEEYGSEYDSYNTEDDVDFNFDGNIQNDDEFFDLEQASEVLEIPEAITITADAIEWNKELYSRLDGKRKEIIQVNPSANIDQLDSQISDRLDRIADLEEMLDGWADCRYNYNANNEFEEFPNIDIDYSNADGKNKFAKMKRNRYKQVQKAKENARKKREKITIVKTSLNPIIDKGKIVVPSSSFEGIPEGTGLTGLDDSNDFDAPPTLTYELTSNADGSGKTKVNMTGIVIGVAVGLLGIWAIKKYKLIK